MKALAVLLMAAFAGLGLIWLAERTAPGEAAIAALKAEVHVRQVLRAADARRAVGNAMVGMPDGVRLATDVYLPRGDARPRPAVLVRLPYGKRSYFEVWRWMRLFLPRGYAVVVQDMRGRHGSEGVFAPYPQAKGDGAATLDWIASQDWSNGRVGTIGCSALGEVQLMLGTRGHPALGAMIPIGAGGAVGAAADVHGYFGMFEGGIPTLAAAFGWFSQFGGKTADAMARPQVDHFAALRALPVRDAVARWRDDPTDYEALLDGLTTPGLFSDWGYLDDSARIDAPTLIADTWFDPALRSTLAIAGVLAGNGPAPRVLISPGTHCDLEGPFVRGAVGDVPVDPVAALDMDAVYALFMDASLRGVPAPDLPAYTVYVMRQDRWLRSDTWPPGGARAMTLRLAESALVPGDAAEDGARSFVSDPADPVPALGGAICCTGDPATRAGPVDQTPIERRGDVLVYTSAPLETPVTLAGQIRARLWVSADVPDTDLVVRLTEATPDGRSLTVSEAGLRLRYRGGVGAPALLTPGEVTEIEVVLPDIAWHVAAGSRLRLHVTGSSFPRLARNMNGGGDPHLEDRPQAARITVHSGPATPSAVVMTVLP